MLIKTECVVEYWRVELVFLRILSLTFIVLSGCSLSGTTKFPVLEGPYLGQSPPGVVAELFAPGVISTVHHEHSGAIFSPDGKELYWTVMMTPLQSPVPSAIMHMKCIDGLWTQPEVASFSGRYSDSVNFFSPDGNQLYFNSTRPKTGDGEPQRNIDVWVVSRTPTGWSTPTRLGSTINTPMNETSAQMTASGMMYFYAYRTDIRAIYRAPSVDGIIGEMELLGPTINSEHLDWCPYVDPEERYIVFASNRPSSLGSLDLYISFAQGDGEWGEAINLGPNINSEFNDRYPCVSPDGKYLFFLSVRTTLPKYYSDQQTYAQMLDSSRRIDNGLSNIYWVDAKFLLGLNPGSD